MTDLSSVVQIHRESFPNFFLSFLGSAFLHQLYIATLMDDSGIAFLAEGEKGICGFVTGTIQPSGFYRRLLRYRAWRFALAVTLPLLKRPSIITRLFRAFSMPNQVTQQAERGTLMSIAVLPEARGSGIGKSLVRTFLAEAAHRGLQQVDLTTDRDNNEAANVFYQKLGFVCMRTFTTPEGRPMNEYVINLPRDGLSDDGLSDLP